MNEKSRCRISPLPAGRFEYRGGRRKRASACCVCGRRRRCGKTPCASLVATVDSRRRARTDTRLSLSWMFSGACLFFAALFFSGVLCCGCAVCRELGGARTVCGGWGACVPWVSSWNGPVDPAALGESALSPYVRVQAVCVFLVGSVLSVACFDRGPGACCWRSSALPGAPAVVLEVVDAFFLTSSTWRSRQCLLDAECLGRERSVTADEGTGAGWRDLRFRADDEEQQSNCCLLSILLSFPHVHGWVTWCCTRTFA